MKSNNKYLNIFLIPFVIFLLGMNFNASVEYTNGGRMPVFEKDYRDTEEHFSFNEWNEVSNPHLSDIIKIGNYIYSIGDLLMYIGGVLMVASLWREAEKLK